MSVPLNNSQCLKYSYSGKRNFSTITEDLQKCKISAVSLSRHLLFSELTQPYWRSQKVNKDLTPSGNIDKLFIFLLQGRVVTETTTEYKEVTDDSGFENFGTDSNFPQLSSSGFGETSASTKGTIHKLRRQERGC